MKAKGSEKVVEQYLGIPFAQPPVGPLRLAAPGPVQGWEGIRNATQHPSMWVYGYINKSNCNISVLNSLFTTKLLYIYSTYTLYIYTVKIDLWNLLENIIIYLNGVATF